jgi:hypothetical protein
MKVQDLFSFGFGSYACSGLVTQLYRYRQQTATRYEAGYAQRSIP